MCGRYTLHTPPAMLAAWLQLPAVPDLKPRFNIAPSQTVPIVRAGADGRECVLVRWGLLPAWSRNEQTDYRLINARAETVASKPAFRAAFRQRRCLIPADGFYEWQTSPHGKQPYHFRLREEDLFAFAGLWERWQGEEGKVIESYTIIVTTANEVVRPVHDRMPVILDAADYAIWLAAEVDVGTLQALLKPYPGERMTAYPVSKRVNNGRYDDSECIVPMVGTGAGGEPA